VIGQQERPLLFQEILSIGVKQHQNSIIDEQLLFLEIAEGFDEEFRSVDPLYSQFQC
jgi:hypothetical protein